MAVDRPTLHRNFRWGLTGEPQSMLVTNGRVVERRAGEMAVPEGADAVDWGGAFLLPKFTDCHCHVLPAGLDLRKLNLSACSTRAEVLDAVRDWMRRVPEDEWVLAVHYDQTKFPDGGHLTRNELDAVCPDRPVILRHSSGHASVANSAALLSAGITEAVKDPDGGAFQRDASGRLTGVLLEKAHEAVTAASPDPTLEQMVEAILLVGRHMADRGIACASDMMTGRFGLAKELEAYSLAVDRGCEVRIRLYPVWSSVFGKKGMGPKALEKRIAAFNEARLHVAGIKIFSDGAIGAGTAAISGGYAGEPDGRKASGTLIYAPERLNAMVREADEAGFRLAIHAIGDRATDVVMDALERTDDPRRHRIEHAMLLSDSQIARLATIGCHISMQPEFLEKFAHTYRRQLGPERARSLKRFRSVIDAGIRLSLSSDRPIVEGDPWRAAELACDRPEGFDPKENITRREALVALTALAAEANGERDGALEPGQTAEFSAYAQDPLAVSRPKLLRDFSPTRDRAD